MRKIISRMNIIGGLAVTAGVLLIIGFVGWQVFSGMPVTNAQGKPIAIPPVPASTMVGLGIALALPALWIAATMVRRLSRIGHRQATLLKVAQPLFMISMAAFVGLILTFAFFGEQRVRQMAKDSGYMACKIMGGGYFGISKVVLVKSVEECTAAGGSAS